MKRIFTLSVVMFVVAAAFVACGGGGRGDHGGGGVTDKVSRFVFSVTPVFNRPFAASTQQVADASWSLIPTAHAQVQTAIITGNWSGFCDTVPRPEDFGLQKIEFVIYGMGKWNSPDCAADFFSFSADGAPVINAGSVANLVVYASGSGVAADSGTFKVYANGVVTPVTLALGKQAGDRLKARETLARGAVAADDTIFVTMTVNAGDSYKRVRVLLGQL